MVPGIKKHWVNVLGTIFREHGVSVAINPQK